MNIFRRLMLILIVLLGTHALAASPEACRHLLSRTAFGVEPGMLETCTALPYEEAVRHLVERRAAPLPAPQADFTRLFIPDRPLKQMNPDERLRFNRARHDRARQLKAWWLERIVTTDDPLLETMTLFWHNHFTSSYKKVRRPSLLYRQNEMLRAHALGNFAAMLHAVITDPAMLVYLDNQRNVAAHPNENLARELLELFTLGEGHYTEHDVKEAARALSGHGVDASMQYRFKPKQHDSGMKTFLGRSGAFNADDIVDMILQQEQTARFITAKLWNAFISTPPPPERLNALAKGFRDSGYEIAPLLEHILTSPEFTAPAERGRMIKSPVEIVAGTLRSFHASGYDARHMAQFCRRLGQDLFDPPNVKGWPGGAAWITTATLLDRKAFLARFARGKEMGMHYDVLFGKAETAAFVLLPLPADDLGGDSPEAAVQTILQHPFYQLK